MNQLRITLMCQAHKSRDPHCNVQLEYLVKPHYHSQCTTNMILHPTQRNFNHTVVYDLKPPKFATSQKETRKISHLTNNQQPFFATHKTMLKNRYNTVKAKDRQQTGMLSRSNCIGRERQRERENKNAYNHVRGSVLKDECCGLGHTPDKATQKTTFEWMNKNGSLKHVDYFIF